MPIPLRSDRSAHNDVAYPELHAKDLDDGTPIHHLPDATDVGDMPVWDGTKWTITAGMSGGQSYEAAFGDASPATIFSIDAVTLVEMQVQVTQVWNGTGASIKIGIDGDDDLFFETSETELTALAAFLKGFAYDGPADIILTIVPGSGATTGTITITIRTF